MNSWQSAKIEECCQILDHLRVPVNEEERSKRIGDVPYFGANGLQGYIDDYIFDEPLILIAEDGGYFDEYASRTIAYQISGKSWVNNHAHILRAINGFSQDYIFYCLEHKDITPYIKGGTRAKLNQKELREITILAPPWQQQYKIAQILKTIDTLISQTHSLIAKYNAIKHGMMQDLLTRGVDKGGQLRTDYHRSPELYKGSDLGPIPNTWEIESLSYILKDVPNAMRSGPFGSALLKSELVENGIPLLGIDNVHPESFCCQYNRFVSADKFNELQRYAVRPNDVMITIMGTVGRCCTVPIGIGLALSSKHVWTMTIDEQAYLPELICWQLNYAPWVLSQFERGSQGGVMDAISSSTLRKLQLPVPPMDEQIQIARKYIAMQATLQTEQEAVSKYKLLKSGLMQDLLTGKVRVKIDASTESTNNVGVHQS